SVKFLELLLAERPVVTEAVGELGEYLRESSGGQLVSPGDEAAFAAATAALLQTDSTTCHNIGQAAATHLWQNYDWTHLVERVEGLYKEILCERPST
ncbi:MAG: glycosyltransferase, partial [Chloroflexota bacterium]